MVSFLRILHMYILITKLISLMKETNFDQFQHFDSPITFCVTLFHLADH